MDGRAGGPKVPSRDARVAGTVTGTVGGAARRDEATLSTQARALGVPSRHEIFRYVAGAGRPVGVAELADHTGLHHNAVRQHVAKLVAAELLVEHTDRRGHRGRPRLAYTVEPAVDGRWGVVGPYERLALLLAEMVRTGDDPLEVGRRAGRLDREPGRGGLDNLVAAMGRHGFSPVVERDGDRVEVVLRACPFENVALADPGIVCGLHLGLARGVVEVGASPGEASSGGLVVDELVPNDPRSANCRLRCRLA